MKGSMALVGACYACIMVSTFATQGAAARMGYPKDIDTYLLISGTWTSSLYLGCFAGPTLAGFMVERIGFRHTTILFWAVYLAILLADFLECCFYLKISHDENLKETIVRLVEETVNNMADSFRGNNPPGDMDPPPPSLEYAVEVVRSPLFDRLPHVREKYTC